MAFGFIGKLLGRFAGSAAAPRPQTQKAVGEHGGRGRRKRRGRHAVGRQDNAGGGTQNQGQQRQRQGQSAKPLPGQRQNQQQKKPQGQGQQRPRQGQPAKRQPERPPRRQDEAARAAEQNAAALQAQEAASVRAVPPVEAASVAPANAASDVPSESVQPASADVAAKTAAALPQETAAAILEAERQVVFVVRAEDKFRVLVNLMSLMSVEKTVVFCNKKTVAEEVHRSLSLGDVRCGLLTGGVSEEDRRFVQGEFESGEMPLVVVTDGFCGGIDLTSVGCLVNYDFPYEAEDYVRRLGGEANALSMGRVVSFADEDESSAVPDIESRLGVAMKCAVVVDGDPLLDEVVAAEAEPVEPPPPYASIKDGVPIFDAAGREGRLVIGGDGVPRPLPSFSTALDPKKPQMDETDVYVRPLRADVAVDGWSPTA